jgi:hypothetical protein
MNNSKLEQCPKCGALAHVDWQAPYNYDTKQYKAIKPDVLYKAALEVVTVLPCGPLKDNLVDALLEVGSAIKPPSSLP